MSRVAAFIAGLGAGYMSQSERERDRKRQEKRDQMEQERFDAEKSDREDKKRDKQLLRDAARPIEVEQPNDVLKDDDGNDMPPVPAYRAGAERFETRDAAAAAAQKGNAPGARQARMLGAMEQTGDYAGAAQLRTAQVQATMAEQQLADRAMRDKLSSLRTPDELATMISETPADGMGGALKVRAVTSPDGKSFGFVQIGPDGTEKPVPGTFSNDEAGMEKARMLVAGYTTPEMRQQYFRWEQERAQRAAEFKETKAFQEKQLAQQGQYQSGMLANSAAQVANSAKLLDLQRRKLDYDLKSDPFGKVPGAIKAQAQSLSKQIETINSAIAQAQAKGDFNAESGGELIKRMTELTLKYNALLQPYTGAVKAMADPAEFRAPAAGPKQASAGVPTQQPATPQGPPQAAQGIPPPAQAVPVVPLPQAQQDFAAAAAKLQTYGLRQRKADPQGFAAAQAAAAQAKAVLDAATAQAQAQAAEENRRRFASAQGPALVTPQP
jgi:hypothetical protein